MPLETGRPTDPQEWVRRARSNLVRAEADARLSGVCLEDLCFDAQQTAEKAIKAAMIHLSIPFPYVHDLRRLMMLIEKRGVSIPREVRNADALTKYASEARYPGAEEPVDEEEYREALSAAKAVLRWAEGIINSRP